MNHKHLHFVLLLLFSQLLLQSSFAENSVFEKDNFLFLEMDIVQLQQGYKDGKFTVKEVVQAYLKRIDKIDKNGPSLHSIIMLNPDAISIAEKMDKEMKQSKNKLSPLFGIPVVIKDNIDTHDNMPCTAGSRALKNSYPLKDSYVAKQLREAGAIIIAKSNLSEWANFRGQLSTSGWSGLGGLTKNPYVLSRNPCGSSSGSAVAVSANLTMIAIGTETDGSIVCPSQTNGIVGIKPTVGLVSRAGVIPISSTQDTPGPMGRTVRDVAICLGALTGVDSTDVKTLASPGHFYKDYTQFLKKDRLKGKRIGLFKAPYGINYKVDTLMNRAVRYLKNQGVEIIEISEITNSKVDKYENEIMLYEYKDGLNNYFRSLGNKAPVKNIDDLIAFNKADSIELRYFNQHHLEEATKKGDLNSKEYKAALDSLLKGSREDGIDKVMNEHKLDAIIAPTGSPAWKSDLTNGDSFQIGTSSPAAQSGYPNITVPMGFIDELPVGISFFGRVWSEPVLFEIAYSYEQGTLFRKAPTFLKE
jgi:amidase